LDGGLNRQKIRPPFQAADGFFGYGQEIGHDGISNLASIPLALLAAYTADAGLSGEFRTALGTAARQNGTPPTGGHAGTKTMTASADQAAGLIGAFHWDCSGLKFLSKRYKPRFIGIPAHSVNLNPIKS
jgi:hypothetical protein